MLHGGQRTSGETTPDGDRGNGASNRWSYREHRNEAADVTSSGKSAHNRTAPKGERKGKQVSLAFYENLPGAFDDCHLTRSMTERTRLHKPYILYSTLIRRSVSTEANNCLERTETYGKLPL
ncbi:hypothetical protein ZHAS_00014044 [Anopheles sinensis]|uniref:Uncharacterized protein n=1 Tax=Anopheles sinensis TaxID=74873 RepID=A0A084W777_ANOSI|nr:hypothetical protein ZHAS_00014044 [Anopheles sinensis]